MVIRPAICLHRTTQHVLCDVFDVFINFRSSRPVRMGAWSQGLGGLAPPPIRRSGRSAFPSVTESRPFFPGLCVFPLAACRLLLVCLVLFLFVLLCLVLDYAS